MSQPLEQMVPAPDAWCGRSWEGLVDRRYAALQQAVALRNATAVNSREVVNAFLAFFDQTGIELFRDEEEWIFRSLQPTPEAVVRALEGHIQISELIAALLDEAREGCLDLRVVHHLGGLLETHLLLEEAEIRPLLHASRISLLPVR